MFTHRLRRPVLMLSALVLCGLCALAGATGAAPAAHASAAESDTTPGKLMLVLDSSGSMKEPAAGGETKIGAAKKALNTVVGRLPSNQPVGLRVFGAKVFSAKDAGACTDSQVEVPVGTDNRGDLRSAIASYKPFGETPIGYALQQAGKDLGSSGKRSIVLVSDGVPTCQPDPCVVAKKLASQGVDLKIDVVGLDVNSRARSDLECIAHAGHGVYYDVDNSKDFAASLVKVATRAARPYAAIGQRVTGTAAAQGAPVIGNGDWLDRTDGSQERHYTIKRTLDGSTIHFSAAFRDPENSVFNTVTLSSPDGRQCQASGAVDALSSNVLVSSATTAGPLNTFGNVDESTTCATSKTLDAKVTYSGRSQGVPVELRVTELPKVSNLGQLPAQLDKLAWVAPPSGAPSSIEGGTSFDDAPLLQPGSYRDNVVQGETLTYQVKVDWGQQLTAQVRYPGLAGRRAAAVKGDPVSAVRVFAPTRAPASSGPDGHQERANLFGFGGPVTLGTATGPVRFRNTGASYDGIGGADDAGVYTVTVFMDKRPGSASIPIPFTLDLGVSGTTSGVPEFVSTPVAPESATPSPSPSGAADGATSTDSGQGGGGGFPAGPVLGGLGVLAILAAIVVTLRARRTAT